MSYLNEETPSVAVKKKNILQLAEYCIENKMEFTVKPRISGGDDFEVEFKVGNVKKAIALGMFLREQRLELIGFTPAPVLNHSKNTVKKAAPASPAKEEVVQKEEIAPVPVPPVISFEDDSLQLDLG